MSSGRVFVTGVGMCSSLGVDHASMVAHLSAGTSGIRRFPDYLPGFDVWAGLLDEKDNAQLRREARAEPNPELFDRTGQLALAACRRALSDALLADGWDSTHPERMGLVFGTSHGGRQQLDAFVVGGSRADEPRAAELVLERAAHHVQSAAVAAALNVHGPVLTLSSACGSSGVAIAHGFELLRSGQADIVLAGGADAFSRLTYAGFAALGAVADGPTGPFSSRIGMTLGEGAGFVVLERCEDALARHAMIRAELLGYGLSWDAYHLTEPEPSGAGIARALSSALERAAVTPEQVGCFYAHGTGTRANDAAECLAIARQFGAQRCRVPVVSTKSFTGHALGASTAFSFIIATLSMGENLLPPTVNFGGPRPGCDLDFVPNQSRALETRVFAVNSAAFGGANASLVAGRPRQSSVPERADRNERMVISGLGVMSALGAGQLALAAGLGGGQTGLAPLEPAWTSAPGGPERCGGLIHAFDARRLVPTLDVRRADRVMQFSLVASHEALLDAGLSAGLSELTASQRTGLVVGTCRGAVTSFAKYLESVAGANWAHASATHFPNLVMSSIGGFISKALGLRGIASTVVGSASSGLAALGHAIELFRMDLSQDAVVVVAGDQLERLFFSLEQTRGRLAAPQARLPALYDSSSSGVLLGEGAVAVVVERESHAMARGVVPYAVVSGLGTSHDAAPNLRADPAGLWLSHAIEQALARARVVPSAIDAVYGHGSGDALMDLRELVALERVFGAYKPAFSCPTGNIGLVEAATGLFGVAAACLGLRRGCVFPVVSATPPRGALDCVLGTPRARDCRNILVTASGTDGANAASVLSVLPC